MISVSGKLIAHALTDKSTCFGPGCGSGTSFNTKVSGPPLVLLITALIVALLCLLARNDAFGEAAPKAPQTACRRIDFEWIRCAHLRLEPRHISEAHRPS